MHISILGAGAWGTALAKLLSDFSDNRITLWTKNSLVIESINQIHENKIYLPGFKLKSTINITDNIKQALKADIILIVIPAQEVRTLLKNILPYLNISIPIVICSKGIELISTKLMSEVAEEIIKNDIFILSGPNLAKEVATQLPSAAVLAGKEGKWRNTISNSLQTTYFKILEVNDLLGVQAGGALKNVIAIACGIIEGRGWGENAKAALVTLGFQEMLNFCSIKGGNTDTLSTFCGIGDLFLTCNSRTSRNMQFGYKLGMNEIVIRKELVEGVYTAKAIYHFSEQKKLFFPLCRAIYKIIYEKLSIEEALLPFYSN